MNAQELINTAIALAACDKGLLAMDKSNPDATGLRDAASTMPCRVFWYGALHLQLNRLIKLFIIQV